MNKTAYDDMNTRELEQAIDLLQQQFPALTGSEVRLRSILKPLIQRVASNTRAYELLGIKTAEDMALVWRVSLRRAQAIIANRHERFGTGMRIGKTWVLSAEEAESIVIDAARRRS